MERRRRMKPIWTAMLLACALFILLVHEFLFIDPLRGGDRDVEGGDYFFGILGRYRRHSATSETKFDSDRRPLSRKSAAPVLSPRGYAVLFPDWEAFVLPYDHENRPSPSDHHLCLFQDGSTSPANFSSYLPRHHRAAFRCSIPYNIRRLRRILAPQVVLHGDSDSPRSFTGSEQILRWTFLVYESLSTAEDIVVFAKGVNSRRGTSERSATSLRCVFLAPGAATFRSPVTSSSQEVFRCRHPPVEQLRRLQAASASVNQGIKISLEILGEREAVPSLAEYKPPAILEEQQQKNKFTLCACTMVFNVAKFLQEWVTYHSRIGVENFILYDNGSEDELGNAVDALVEQGYNVSAVPWIWPKTQEASFSHSAVAYRESCRWMMYLDVDEFAFSPSWSKAASPSSFMLQSILPPEVNSPIGQISMDCFDFGPSNLTVHPKNGVTQGYTCRRRHSERHKSVVLLEAVDSSLRNVIHHFKLREGYVVRSKPLKRSSRVVVNHYKYQAWPEFKTKFRRRASAFVADWTGGENPQSKDRTPGLGSSPVEPADWRGRFCDVRDFGLRNLTRRWFCGRPSGGDCRMMWETSRR